MKRKIYYFAWICFLCLMNACTSEAGLGIEAGQQGEDGQIELAFTGTAPTRSTTTTISPEEAKNFLITVSQGEGIIRGPQTLGTMDMRFPAGQGYKVYAESCTESDAEIITTTGARNDSPVHPQNSESTRDKQPQ